MKYYKKLVGEKCYLSPINLGDVKEYTDLINDFETEVNLGCFNNLVNENKEKEMLESFNKGSNHHFAIIKKDNNELLGNCSIFGRDRLNRSAKVGIFIGKEEVRNRGFGKETLNLLLDFGFNVLNLKNIMLEVFEFNKRALNLYEKIGFKEIGRRRQAYFFAGQYHDIIFMDILSEEFESPFIKLEFEKLIRQN